MPTLADYIQPPRDCPVCHGRGSICAEDGGKCQSCDGEGTGEAWAQAQQAAEDAYLETLSTLLRRQREETARAHDLARAMTAEVNRLRALLLGAVNARPVSDLLTAGVLLGSAGWLVLHAVAWVLR